MQSKIDVHIWGLRYAISRLCKFTICTEHMQYMSVEASTHYETLDINVFTLMGLEVLDHEL